MSDFTVYEEIITNGDEWLERDDNAPDLICATFAYPVDMDEVRANCPEGVAAWEKVLDNETFKAGDELHHDFASMVRAAVEEFAYRDFQEYIRKHRELPDPVRNIRVVINNPDCLPNAEARRKARVEELGRYLGRVLGLGRR